MLITRTDELKKICAVLARRPYVAVDTEFVGENSYWPRLCLIQVAHGDQAAAIDPLDKDLDMGPLFELMAAREVVKVFHSGSQDLAIFFRLMRRMPAPVFDTQVAAMACGLGDSISYANLVAALVGVDIRKKMQVTNWAHRPLTRAQLDYSLGDVSHLCDAYEVLAAKLKSLARESWIEEEMNRLTDETRIETDPSESWRRINIRGADRRTLAVLREVAAWRERCAISLNIPRNRVARDETLIDVSFRKPRAAADLEKARGFSSVPGNGVAATEILAAIERGLAAPVTDAPRPHARIELTDGLQAQVSLLQTLLRVRAEEHGIAQRLIATRLDLEALVDAPEGEHRLLAGWRRDLFGEDALKLLRGELAITGDAAGTRIVATRPVAARPARPRASQSSGPDHHSSPEDVRATQGPCR